MESDGDLRIVSIDLKLEPKVYIFIEEDGDLMISESQRVSSPSIPFAKPVEFHLIELANGLMPTEFIGMYEVFLVFLVDQLRFDVFRVIWPERSEVDAARRAVEGNYMRKYINGVINAEDTKVIDGISPSDLEILILGKI